MTAQYNDLREVGHHGGKVLLSQAYIAEDLMWVGLVGRCMLGTNAVLLLHGVIFAEVVSTCRTLGSEFMDKQLCLCTRLADGGIWEGKRHVKSVSSVQVLSGDMTDGVVKLHEVDQEADGTWWQAILVTHAKKAYGRSIKHLANDSLRTSHMSTQGRGPPFREYLYSVSVIEREVNVTVCHALTAAAGALPLGHRLKHQQQSWLLCKGCT